MTSKTPEKPRNLRNSQESESAAVWVDINDLHAWTENPRKIEAAVPKVAESIKRFGFGAPILARRDNNEIIAGHTRWHAAKTLKLERVPVRFLDLDPAEAHLLALADNRLNEVAEWNDAELVSVLGNFGLDDAELAGWNKEDIEKFGTDILRTDILRGEVAPEDIVEDEAPEPPAIPTTQPGDLYIMGNHRLVCGDSTSEAVVSKCMDGKVAQLVFTDPPYGVDYAGGAFTPREKLSGDESASLYGPATMIAYRFSDEKAPLYLWHAAMKGLSAAAAGAAAAAQAAGYEIRAEIVWNKNVAQFGAIGAQYKQKHEPAFYCFKRKTPPRWYGPTNETTVWDFPRAAKNEFHPTQKPVGLAARAMANSSIAGDIVLDLFGGSGSTLIAAEQTDRSARLVELAPGYCDVIVKRWETLTGNKAERIPAEARDVA